MDNSNPVIETHLTIKQAIQVLLLGLIFGFVMTQSQAISWYRIYEMFRFESFHMYGIIGSTVVLGVLLTRAIRRFRLRDIDGNPIFIADKAPGWKRYLFGGLLFGLGWGLVGACPGPMFVLMGHGLLSAGVILVFAILGTWIYGLIRHVLPH